MEDRYLGKRLDGRYEIKEILGVGGMAVVYKATDLLESRTVAVKILKDEYAGNDEFVHRFLNEARAISVLNHNNIVKVYDASVSDAVKYMVMEFIDGITLKEYIAQQGCLRWKDAVFFAVQILRALQHAHDKGIVHRDVKPQNIMLLSDGTVKVADFGIARFARSSQKTITDKAIGSVHYISPEQARGDITDEKADIYSVGVIMYEMLTGKLPFEAESAVSVAIMQLQNEPQKPTELDPSIPLGVEQITLHAMQKEAHARYQSAAEMLHDLEDFRRDPDMTFNFSYFVDDSPTKFVEFEEATPIEETEKTEEEEKTNILPILTGVAIAFCVVILVIGVIFISAVVGGQTTGHEVVDFTGHTYTSVYDDYHNVFSFEVKYEYNSDYEPGIVIAQSKPAGQKVKKTQVIVLTVSSGDAQVAVPEINGFTVSQAKLKLEKVKLSFEIEYQETEEYVSGTVIESSPAQGTLISEGTVVKLLVAQTPGVVAVEVPNVTKSSLASAKKLIESAGFTLEKDIVKVYSNGYTLEGEKITVVEGLPEGYVAKQDPNPEETKTAPKGSAITLYASNGLKLYSMKLDCLLGSADVSSGKAKIVAYMDGTKIGESETIAADATVASIKLSTECKYNENFGEKTVVIKIKNGNSENILESYTINFEKNSASLVH